MSDGDLWGALGRAASEAAKAGKELAGRAAAVARDQLPELQIGREQLRFPSGLLTGPIVPQPYKAEGTLTWHDGYMASCAVSVARAVQQHGLQPATTALVAAQAAVHFKPGGYRLLQVGLNAHRVFHYKEWRRLGTSLAVHSDLPHLVSNSAGLVLEGLPLEQRLGSAKLVGLVASSALLTQALYLLSARVAADRFPSSSLANDYYLAYSVGFSGVAMALKVVAGYMREADLARARVPIPEEFMLTAGRLGAWPSLIMAHYLVPAASLPGHLCGIAAGVLQVYAARGLSWLWRRLRGGRRRLANGRVVGGAAGPSPKLLDLGSDAHPGLGWMDLGSHLLLGVGTLLMAYLSARQRRGGGLGGR